MCISFEIILVVTTSEEPATFICIYPEDTVSDTSKMVETTYQNTKYQTPGTTEIYSHEIGNTQCHNPQKTEIYVVVG